MTPAVSMATLIPNCTGVSLLAAARMEAHPHGVLLLVQDHIPTCHLMRQFSTDHLYFELQRPPEPFEGVINIYPWWHVSSDGSGRVSY